MRESQVEAYLVKRVKACGGEVRKVKWIGRNSCPDRLVMLNGRSFWVELKSPTGKSTPAQIREHDRLSERGQTVMVLHDKQEVDAVIEYYLSLERD